MTIKPRLKNDRSDRTAVLLAPALLALLYMPAWASRPNMERYWESCLQRHGFPSQSSDDILKATQSESYFVRYIALELLAHRTEHEAIPALKQALNDPHVRVRWAAGHLLGTLGDKSGAERMRLDYAELVPRNGEPTPVDPNIAKDPQALRRWERHRRYRIRRALEVAKVLAELGDNRGYRLAAREGLATPLAGTRTRAVKVLIEIAKLRKTGPGGEHADCISALSAIAESEPRESVMTTLLSNVSKLGPDDAERILTRAKDNPHQGDRERRWASRHLEALIRAKQEGRAPKEPPKPNQ